jgi:uncharacterized protein YjbJ (UPF0337 family)
MSEQVMERLAQSIDTLNANLATGQQTQEATFAKRAGQNHALAKQTLSRLEELFGELEQTVGNLTDPRALAAEGNLGWYRHEAQARIGELRQAFAQLEDLHGQVTGHLASQGIQVQ